MQKNGACDCYYIKQDISVVVGWSGADFELII